MNLLVIYARVLACRTGGLSGSEILIDLDKFFLTVPTVSAIANAIIIFFKRNDRLLMPNNTGTN